MNNVLKKETKYELHVFFTDGRNLFLTDELEEIYNYLEMWSGKFDYCSLKKLRSYNND